MSTRENTVSHFSYAPFLRAGVFSQKCWNRTFSMIIYLMTFYLFDDIETKYRNHSCESFCYAKGNFDKSARLLFLRFALGIIHGEICDRKTPKTIILFK